MPPLIRAKLCEHGVHSSRVVRRTINGRMFTEIDEAPLCERTATHTVRWPHGLREDVHDGEPMEAERMPHILVCPTHARALARFLYVVKPITTKENQ